jgi:ZIP family zinc transporter
MQEAIVVAFAAGIIGTGLGGIIAVLIPPLHQKKLCALLGFAGGIMIAIVCFDLMPEAFQIDSIWTGLIGLLVGIFLIVLLDFFMPHVDFISQNKEEFKFMRTGILVGIGIALHNFPEGLAIGAGYAASKNMGITLAIIMAIQNFPEGLAMATPMRVSRMRRGKILLLTVFAGLPMGVGALAGNILGNVSPFFLSLALGFAGGAMLYITCDELIPTATSIDNVTTTAVGLLTGLIIGMALSSIL